VLNGERTRRQVLTWEGNRGELKDERPIPLAAGLPPQRLADKSASLQHWMREGKLDTDGHGLRTRVKIKN